MVANVGLVVLGVHVSPKLQFTIKVGSSSVGFHARSIILLSSVPPNIQVNISVAMHSRPGTLPGAHSHMRTT